MTEAWFSPELAPWLSLMSLLSLLSYLQPMAIKGINRKLVMGSYWGE